MTDHKPPTGGLWDLSSLVSGAGGQPPPASPPVTAPPPPDPPTEQWTEPAQRAEPEVVPPPSITTPPEWTVPRPEPDALPNLVASAPVWSGRRIPSVPAARRPLVLAGAAVALVVILGAVFVGIALNKPDEPAIGDYAGQATVEETSGGGWADTEPAPPEVDVTIPPEPTPETTTLDPEQAALAELERIHAEDLAAVYFQGQYAVQIASKYPGIVDGLQRTAGGSHVFQATDILAEHQRLRAQHADVDHLVVLLKSTDYGKRQVVGGQFLWVTFALGAFPDGPSVVAWCDTHFADLPPAERENQCAVRRLEP